MLRKLLSILFLVSWVALAAHGQIAFEDSSETTTNTSNSCVATVPAGVSDGHVMVLGGQLGDNDSGTLQTDPASNGWTEIDHFEESAGGDQTVGLWYRVASSEPASYTIEWDHGAPPNNSCFIVAYSGVDNTTPLDVVYAQGTHYSRQTATASPDPASITTNNDNAMVVVFVMTKQNGVTAYTPSSGFDERIDMVGGVSQGNSVADDINATAGALDPGTVTCTGCAGTDDHAVFTIALREAATASPSTILLRRRR